MTVFYAAVHDPLLVFQKYDLPFYRKLILSHVCVSGCAQTAFAAVGCVYVCPFLPVHEVLNVCMCVYVDVNIRHACVVVSRRVKTFMNFRGL